MNEYKIVHPSLAFNEYKNLLQVTQSDGINVYCNKQEYIDGISGLWNMILGHNNSEIKEAIISQMESVDFISPWTCCTKVVYDLANKLIKFTDNEFSKVMFTCSGSESIELAIKLVRRHQSVNKRDNKKYIAVFDTSYHGTYFGAMTASGVDRDYFHEYNPMLSGFAYLPIPVLNNLNKAYENLEKFFERYGEKLAAFILEPVLGVAGIFKIPNTYMKRLKKLCKEYNVLIVFDEVSTGFYRTGVKFAYKNYDFIPDIVCLSKAINNGILPLGAVLIGESVAKCIGAQDVISHFSTQNSNPICCATGIKTIEILERDNYEMHIREVSNYFKEKIKIDLVNIDLFKNFRIEGLMIAIELNIENDFYKIQKVSNILKENYLLNYPFSNQYSSGIILMPPYIIKRPDVDKIICILKNVLSSIGDNI